MKEGQSAAAAAKSLQSCLTLCNPVDDSPPGSPVPGILQARTLEWVAISFSNAWKWKVKVKSLSHVWLFPTPWTAAHQAPPSMDFPGKRTGVGCHSLLLGQSKEGPNAWATDLSENPMTAVSLWIEIWIGKKIILVQRGSVLPEEVGANIKWKKLQRSCWRQVVKKKYYKTTYKYINLFLKCIRNMLFIGPLDADTIKIFFVSDAKIQKWLYTRSKKEAEKKTTWEKFLNIDAFKESCIYNSEAQ